MYFRTSFSNFLPTLKVCLLGIAFIQITAEAFWQSKSFGQETNTEQSSKFDSETSNRNPKQSDESKLYDLESLNDLIQPSIVTIRVTGRDGDELAIGTGFVISADGLIVTNSHVIGEGRSFTVELPEGRKLPVLSIEASDQAIDLAVLRVNVENQPLSALKLSQQPISPGLSIAAFGNPLGLRNSVVSGVISAVREVQGRELIQLAMPTQPGNSGGPLVDMEGKVRGIINMKSAIDDNLGFAIPVDQLIPILNDPHSVRYDRWVTLGRLDPSQWKILFGATWKQTGGVISAQGSGGSFGGRSLCLSQQIPNELPVEIAVDVRLDDEGGAAGLAFYSDGNDAHYGFYPSNGNLRLTCFKGPSVYSWEVLADAPSKHYRPKNWNRLRVRLEKDRFKCYVNDELFIESIDRQITSGSVGLVKFRDTKPDFRRFEIGKNLESPGLSPTQQKLITRLLTESQSIDDLDQATLRDLSKSNEAVGREIERNAAKLELKILQMRRLAEDIKLQHTLDALQKTLSDSQSEPVNRLLRGALLIAKLDNDDTEPKSYIEKVDSMAEEIFNSLPKDADALEKRRCLDQYLFEENGFHGGQTEYYHPANSHLDRVIDEREGLPITLSILYIELGKRIGLDIVGIGLPGHFVVQHRINANKTQIIDVYDRGKNLSEKESAEIVRNGANRTISAQDLVPQSDSAILTRVVNNLLGSARRNSDTEAFRRYCEALVAIEPNEPEFRIMRSQARAITKRFTGAIEDMDWLIERIPEGQNRRQALQLRESLVAEQEQEMLNH